MPTPDHDREMSLVELVEETLNDSWALDDSVVANAIRLLQTRRQEAAAHKETFSGWNASL